MLLRSSTYYCTHLCGLLAISGVFWDSMMLPHVAGAQQQMLYDKFTPRLRARIALDSQQWQPVYLQLADADEQGMVFDCLHPFVLRAVHIYAEATGARIVQLQDAEGKSLGQKVVFVDETGWVRIPLNLSVPTGQGLGLIKVGGKPLFANTSAMTGFPFELEDVLIIRESTVDEQSWSYLYNWEVEYEELCSRSEVFVPVDSSTTALATAAFVSSADTLDLTDMSSMVSFTDLSEHAVAWLWDFGDGISATIAQPSHACDTAGMYIVSLSVADGIGCAVAALDTIIVLGPFVTTSLQAQSGVTAYLAVYDLFGRRMACYALRTGSEMPVVVDVTQWPAGTYVVVWHSGAATAARRVLKQ